MISKMKYKRVLLKLSGEALLGNKLHGIDEKIVTFLANEIKKVYKKKNSNKLSYWWRKYFSWN